MKNVLYLLILFCSCTSCISYKPIRATEVKSIKALSLTFAEVKIRVELGIENPNNYAITLKQQNMRAYINGNDVGEIFIEERIKLPRKSNQIYSLTLVPNASKIVSALPSVMMIGSAEAALKGNLKIKAGWLSKKIDVDLKKKVTLDDLQF